MKGLLEKFNNFFFYRTTRLALEVAELRKEIALMSKRLQSCPPDTHQYLSSCFWVSSTRYNWTDARTECINRQMRLASVHNKQENDFINGEQYFVFFVIKCSKTDS